MKPSQILGALALTAASFAATAGPVDLGTGPGTYDFGSSHDQSFFLTLGPGSYVFDSTVTSQGFDLVAVWLSYSKDMKPGHGNDIDTFDSITPSSWTEVGFGPLVLTQATQIYIDVDTKFGKKFDGAFDGHLVVSSVPEPATVPMLLAGFGIVGWLARRRRA